MKILQIITPSRISGAEKYLLSLSKELKKLGCELYIVIEKGERFITYINQDINQELPVIPLKIEGKGNIFGYRRLKRLICNIKPDIIHTHLTTASWFSGWIGTALNIPVVSTVHAINPRYPYIRADKIIAVSQAVYDDLLSKNIKPTQLEVIQNGIPIPSNHNTHTQSLKDKLKIHWNIPKNNLVIGVIAHFSKKKGHQYLLHAFAQLNVKNVTLVFCGEGKLENKLKLLCKKLLIQNKVIFTGFQKEMSPFYSIFDLVILPSIAGEGLPLSILEAFSYGIPVIASSISGIGEAIETSKDGFLVPPKDSEALLDKMGLLLQNRSLANEMGNKGKEKIVTHFNMTQNAQKVLAIYTSLY